MSQSPSNDSSRQNISDSQTVIDSLTHTIEELQIALKLIKQSDNTSYSANPSIVKKIADSTAQLITSLDNNSVTEISFNAQLEKSTEVEEIDSEDDDDWGGLIRENGQKDLPSFTSVETEKRASFKSKKLNKKSKKKNKLLTILLAIVSIIIISLLAGWLYQQNNQKNLQQDGTHSELESTIFNNVAINKEGLKLKVYPELESDFDSAEIFLTKEKEIDFPNKNKTVAEGEDNQFYSAINESPVEKNNYQVVPETNKSIELSEKNIKKIQKNKIVELENNTSTKSINSSKNDLNLQDEKQNNQETVITEFDNSTLQKDNDNFGLSPEQMLVQNIESKVKEITNQFGNNLIAGVKADFRQNYLLIIVKQQWYKLPHSQQDNLVEIVFSQAKILDFDRFEVEDINHNLVARNAVVGNKVLIISR